MENSKNILILEDDPNFVQAISSKLIREGFVVDIAKNGFDGLKFAQEKLYSLIILDVMMPIMDGSEALKKIRGGTKNTNTPIFVLSAVPKDALGSSIDQSLCTEILSKSDIGPDELIKIIKKSIK